MLKSDNIIKELDQILSKTSGFERDSYLQVNGENIRSWNKSTNV